MKNHGLNQAQFAVKWTFNYQNLMDISDLKNIRFGIEI